MVIDLDARRGAVEVLIDGRERGLAVRVSLMGNVRVHQAKLFIDKSPKESHSLKYLHVVDDIRSSLSVIVRSEESQKNNPTNTMTIKQFIIFLFPYLSNTISPQAESQICVEEYFSSEVDVASDW